jgi:long-chain acyl-CoA synthetase
MGLDPSTYADLCERVTHIVHSAADLRVDATVEDLRGTNVEGVANVLSFARSVRCLACLVHVSTAYVAGVGGTVREDDLTDAFGFGFPSRRSDEAECLIRDAISELRSRSSASMIVGPEEWRIKTFNTFYAPLRLFLSGKLRIIPARRDLRVNIVPVDYVADAIVRLMFDSRAVGMTFHLTTPTDELPTAGDVLAFARRWARERLGVRLPSPVFLPIGLRVGGRTVRLLRPYFRERRRFRRDNTDEVLGPTVPGWYDYLPTLLKHATAAAPHRSDHRHGRVLFRLAAAAPVAGGVDAAGGRAVTGDDGSI